MIERIVSIGDQFPVRKSKKQKAAFRQAATGFFTELGYSCHEEAGSLGARNLIVGDPKTANYVVTAHYDTCARLPMPNLITPRSLPPFLGYQLLVVAFFFAICGVCYYLFNFLLGDSFVAFLISYAVLWIQLVLMMVGPANPHNRNDNTSGVVTVLSLAERLPEELRDQVCFVLFDLEEAGLWGSAGYRKHHKKEVENQINLNLDCVGEGDEIWFFPTKELRKDMKKMEKLTDLTGTDGVKSLSVHQKGFSYYPSDQKNFPYGVGICALRNSRWAGQWLGRIHTPKDVVLDTQNVNFLCDRLLKLIGTV